MAIDYDAIAEAGGIPKGPTRYVRAKAKQLKKDANDLDVNHQVDQRDEYHCRVCGKWCSPTALSLLERAHRHHLQYRSLGGEDTTANKCTLCPGCHAEEHAGKLRLSGDADLRDPGTKQLCGVCVERPSESGWQIVGWV